jgi:L-iduronidase
MGNPSGVFDDFEDLDQLRAWRDLIAELASRCAARYGRAEVREWWFETWNEPDLPFWRWGERGFLNYVDACRAGLDRVDPSLRFGGPGTAVTLSPAFRAFLDHCDGGTNVLTGEAGVRLDFISVHEKASREHEADLTPDPLSVIERERRVVDHIRARHPRLAGRPSSSPRRRRRQRRTHRPACGPSPRGASPRAKPCSSPGGPARMPARSFSRCCSRAAPAGPSSA